MDKKAMKESLRDLTEGLDGRSNSAIVGEFLEEIEAAMARGVRREVILANLRQHGVSLTLQGFQTALRRKRKERATREAKGTNQNKNTTPTIGAPRTELTPAVPSKSAPPEGAANESDEDKEFEDFKKSIAHLPAVQKGKKIADYLEKKQDEKMSLSTRKWLGEK